MKNNYKLWIVLSLITVFTAGVFCGILFEKHILDSKTKRPGRKRTTHFPTLDTMARELNLSPQQQEQVREIFKQNEERMKTMSSQIRKQFSSVRKQLLKEIKNILNEEQTIKFEAMIEKYIERRKKQSERRKKGPSHSRSKKRELQKSK